MEDLLTYSYSAPSNLSKDELFLSHYSELNKGQSQCFFWGEITEPYILSRCLIALSNVVQSSFNLSPFQMNLLKDPIVTAGNSQIRFEGFSHCASVYARVDVLPEGQDGEFLENGTTNVDFNRPMINSLSGVRQNQKVVLSVGEKEFGVHTKGSKTIERKVPLPIKWIKGLTTVQIYLAENEDGIELNKLQAMELFRSIPKSKVKTDYHLQKRVNKYLFTPLKSSDSIHLGGVHRLRLLEGLLPLTKKIKIFHHPEMLSTSWHFYFGNIIFSLTLSRENWRGFSGEGAALEDLLEDVPDEWVKSMDNFSYANQVFNPTHLSIEESLSPSRIRSITSRLAAIGLLGYDLEKNGFFYRRLPFKMERIMSLNPRLKSAEKLIEDNKVEIISRESGRVEARVEGSGGIKHTVILENGNDRCTCTWFSQHQGQRGACKHILATKKLIK